MNGPSSKTVMPDVGLTPETLIPARNLHEPTGSNVHALTFDDFYNTNAGRIGAALELTLQNPELAEDALNEAMARALQRWKQVGVYSNPSGWVYRVAVNWARSWLRRRNRERTTRAPSLIGIDRTSHIEPGLEAALKNLSVDARAVVVCRFHLGLSTAETAEALKIAEGTVKSRLSRALDQLRLDLGVTEEER